MLKEYSVSSLLAYRGSTFNNRLAGFTSHCHWFVMADNIEVEDIEQVEHLPSEENVQETGKPAYCKD